MTKKPTEEVPPDIEHRSKFVWYPGDLVIEKDEPKPKPKKEPKKKVEKSD